MSEETDNGTGALPTLDAKPAKAGSTVLGAPQAKLKAKTNVGKFAVLGVVLVGLLFVVAALMLYQKTRKARTEEPVKAAATPATPGFVERNEALENGAIEKKKAELRKKDAEEAARLKEIEEEARARQHAEALEAARRGGRKEASAATQAQAPAAEANQALAAKPASKQPRMGADGKPEPRPLTPEERRLTGGVLLESTGNKPPTGAQLSEEEAKKRELQNRLSAYGIQPGALANAAGAAATPALFGGAPAGGGSGQGSGGGNSEMNSRLQPTVLQARSASRLQNLDFLLKRGTTIPCALKTGIDTTLPGFVVCIVQNDVYSANGKVRLIDRGATVFGEQQSQLKQGQARTFVVWSRIDNPSGVVANIDSPATDAMGYSGIPGYVDRHFWERFGGAIMMSLIKDFSAAYSQRMARRDGVPPGLGVPYANSQQATQDMATEALKNSINIPPTLTVLPATVVNVMVARDVSFENVYGLVD